MTRIALPGSSVSRRSEAPQVNFVMKDGRIIRQP